MINNLFTTKKFLPVNFKEEFIASISTYLTLSYIFLLNPILLSQAGIDINAAFFATVVSAMLCTFLMGCFNLPFAIAPAPSITTFFVSFVCLKLELSWQIALAAVVFSGIFSIIMTMFSIRHKLINSIPYSLKIGLVLSISGFLIANGLYQGKIISYSEIFINFSNCDLNLFISPNAITLFTGLFTTLILKTKWLRLSSAPILGIICASIVAALFGIKSSSKIYFSSKMFSSLGQADFSGLFKSEFLLAICLFFIIDFFAGIGKYVGLFGILGQQGIKMQNKGIGNALYVDGIGNIIGGLLGASSLAVFVSSAVGIKAGGKTGWTAYFLAALMFLSLFTIPLLGAIPPEATSGILIYIGLLIIPSKIIDNKDGNLSMFDKIVVISAFMISFLTFGIDKAILFIFLIYTGKIFLRGATKNDLILILTTLLLLIAIIAQEFFILK